MSYTYTYSITLDFPDGNVNSTKLQNEIRASSIVTALDCINTNNDNIYIIFKEQLSVEDKTILDGDTTQPAGGLIAAHDNSASPSSAIPVQFLDKTGEIKSPALDSDGYLITSAVKPSAQIYNCVSVNWCDRCSWYYGSVAVENETLTDSGNGLTFTSAHPYWIDMTHGRITFEDMALANNPGKWLVTVKADGETKTEQPVDSEAGDYTVDYPSGNVVFKASQSGKTVTASYSYADTAEYWLIPPVGTKVSLQRVELQFSDDIVINDSVIFQAYGYVQVFAPQYCPNPYPLNTLVPIGMTYKYKTAMDLINDSNGTYPLISAFGGSGWRGLKKPVITLPWTYLSRTDLYSSYGMCVKIYMENSVVAGGTLATATLYCLMETE